MFPRSSRVVLGIALSSVLLAPGLPLAGASAAPAAADRDDVPQLVTVHENGLPAGISADDPTDTKSLLKKSGVEDQSETENDIPHKSLGRATTTYFPAGPSVIPSFSSHVAPACVGDGTDGRRVRVLYVRENSDTSRLAALRASFLNELAQVDDLFAYASGESRRVRWYSDSNCQPIIDEVVLPAGSLSGTHAALKSRLETAGYSNGLHKYLVFAEGNRLGGITCGLGDYYQDTRPDASNANNGGATLETTLARVDTICWFSNSSQAITTHELIHTLGGVLSGAPNATLYGHCRDARDPMCYDDGSDMPMWSVCTQPGAALQLDCNKDDYFNIAPAAGSYLADNWNTANSMFLTTVSDVSDPVPPPAAPTGLVMRARSVTTITPQWTRPSGATKFLIYYGTSSSVSTMKTKMVGNVSSYKLTGFKSNTRYYVRVRAYSASGLISGYSSLASMVTVKDVRPSKPGKPRLTYRSNSALKFTWTKSSRAVRYKLYYGTKSSGSGAKYKNVTGTSYTLTGLSRRKKYYVSVYAYSEGGLVSVRSTRVSGTTR